MTAPELLQEAMALLTKQVTQAEELSDADPRCAALATASTTGKPSVRIVYIERIEPSGLVLNVHLDSGKAQQMLDNPRVALSYYWSALRRQINIEGRAILLSESDSDHYWSTRTRESQLSAWVSNQPDELLSTQDLRQKLDRARKEYSFDVVPRPATWRAFRIEPDRLEFWHADWRKISGRIRYWRDEQGQWHRSEYQP